MESRTLFPRLAGAVVAGGLILGVAAPALAQEAGTESTAPEHLTIDQVRERCQHAIERRHEDLAAAQARLDGVDVLTDDHEATLDGIIAATESGLTGLSAEIDEADTKVVLAQLCAQIASDYRVYLVVLPQAHLTVGADRSDAAVAVGREITAHLDDAIARAAAAGVDVTEAQTLRDQAVAHLESADAANNGVADAVLTVTPASWNEGPGKTVLDGARSSMRTVRSDFVHAAEDGRAAIEALRDAVGDLA